MSASFYTLAHKTPDFLLYPKFKQNTTHFAKKTEVKSRKILSEKLFFYIDFLYSDRSSECNI